MRNLKARLYAYQLDTTRGWPRSKFSLMSSNSAQIPAPSVAHPKSASFRRFLLIPISIIFVLCAIESPAFLGAFDYRTLIGPEHLWWAPNMVDPELLQVHRPHAHQSGAAQGGLVSWGYQIPESDKIRYRWEVTYDHNGFRNLSDLKSADTVVIGDSFVEGLTVPDAQLTTSLLARLQRNVVANLGQAAYGPQQELVVLKRYGLPLQPSAVIWMFSEASDLGDVVSYRNTTASPPGFWHAFYTRSFTRNSLKQVKRIFFPPSKPSGMKRAAAFRASEGKSDTVYFVYPSPPLSIQDLDSIEETTRTIATAHTLSAAQGARLIFVFVPTKFRVFRDYCQFPLQSECRNWAVNDLPERLKKAVTSISPDIGFLDLTPRLSEDAKNGALPYYSDDDHWSPEGHKIAAEAISDYVNSTETRQSMQLAGGNHNRGGSLTEQRF